MSNTTLEEMFEMYLEQARNMSFSGWDFDYITKKGRMVEAPLKWNYHNIVLPWLLKADTLLDMGTGGGEVLSRFYPLPLKTYATEQYQPNVAIARERLEPLGVKVVEIEEEKAPPYNASLPFDDESFNLIINRHEAYYPKELSRMLKKGGVFITQQVGCRNLLNLKQLLSENSEIVSNWNLKSAVKELESAGFTILLQQEDIQTYRFYDIGAIIYLLMAAPWTIQDFSIDKYRDKLWELHTRINNSGFHDAPQHRFIVVAQKQPFHAN